MSKRESVSKRRKRIQDAKVEVARRKALTEKLMKIVPSMVDKQFKEKTNETI